ncbi:P-loop containing nucleoside triphosphate hydrolase protein [Rhypophila sp. PSN 637]
MPHATEESVSVETVNSGIDTTALHELDSEPRQLLDTIDKLRYLGVDSYVELPQIIVVGDQSSGKSSVLEAISRVKFPAKSGLCTRFATELVLRTSPDRKVEAQVIHPRNGYGVDHPVQPLEGYNKSSLGPDELEKIMEEAKTHMGISPQGNGFSQSVLRVQIQGPDLPQLTLVDLPGFFHVAMSKAFIEGREVVESLTARYMAQKSSIILAVITANNDLENQIVLDKARKYDPRRERTLGIITKPDTLEQNSQRERNYINIAKNREGSEYRFKLGWHVLRNRNELESEANTSYEDRDKNEKEFFQSSMWKTLGSGNKGIAELRSRLSSVLFDHVKQSLPEVIRGIEDAVTKRRQRLLGLGDARSSPGQHRAYLGGISSRFERLSRDAIRGIYSDDAFFGGGMESDDSSTADGPSPRKLRAQIRALNRAFAYVLSEKGLTRIIQMPDGNFLPESWQNNDESSYDFVQTITSSYDQFEDPVEVSWNDLNEEIKLEAMSEQGTELPGSMNPSLAFKLFKKQVSPWQGIATRHIQLVMDGVREFIDELLNHAVVDSTTRDAILLECVEPFLEQKENVLAEKLEELLGHYKGDYACQVDEAFLKQLSARLQKRMLSTKDTKTANVSEFNTEGVIDSMLTYYEMSLSTFTENIMILAIENCLIRKIPEMFQSIMVNSMDDDMLARLGSETRSVREEREMLQQDLEILDGGLNECKRYRPREAAASRPSRSSADKSSSLSNGSPSPVRPARIRVNMAGVKKLVPFNAPNKGVHGTLTPPKSEHGRKSSTGSSISPSPPAQDTPPVAQTFGTEEEQL